MKVFADLDQRSRDEVAEILNDLSEKNSRNY
jgi:hypothetical protein